MSDGLIWALALVAVLAFAFGAYRAALSPAFWIAMFGPLLKRLLKPRDWTEQEKADYRVNLSEKERNQTHGRPPGKRKSLFGKRMP